MKSCFTLYDIANTILERMKPSKEQEYLFFAGFFRLFVNSWGGIC